MKVLLSWIKEYLDFNLSPEKIAETLTLAGIEVEAIDEENGEIIFDISLTPNLGHCMSIIGLSRELAALLDLKLLRHKIQFSEDSSSTINEWVSIKVEEEKKCHRYGARVVKNIKVGPSPDWLKAKLEACGYRSINNVVDIGNYVMLESGQPLHLFDYDKIAGKQIHVTSKSNIKSLLTLDDQLRLIPEDVLLICDAKEPIAFAGVIGGKHSAVSEESRNILIESAFFTPEAIRKSSKLLGLRTEASSRFERGVDPEGVLAAMQRVTELLLQLAGGVAVKGEIDVITVASEAQLLECRVSRINQLLGTQLSIREVARFFERLEIKIAKEAPDLLLLLIPTHRHDLRTEIDLIEEIARLYGYNHIPKRIPRHVSSNLPHAPMYLFEEETRRKFLSLGLQEFLTCDLISPQQANFSVEKTLNSSALISVLSPSSIDQSILRANLLPGLLQVVKFNLDRQNQNISGFEVGKIHFKEKEQYLEQSVVGLILTGQSVPHHWDRKPKEVDFYDLKGMVENFLSLIGIEMVIFERSHLQNFHPGRQAYVKIGSMTVGVIGEVHPEHLYNISIEQKVYYGELHLNDLIHLKRKNLKVSTPPAFPGSQRDLTITMRLEAPIGLVTNLVQRIDSAFLEKIELLDLYKSEKIGKDRKNATFRFSYRDKEKTIELPEVELEHARICAKIAEELKEYLIE